MTHRIDPSLNRAGRAAFYVALVAAAVAWAPRAVADAVKFGDLELTGLNVETIIDDKIVFVNAGGFSIQRDIKDVKLIRMTIYPDLGKAEDSLLAKKPGDALASFQRARAGLKHPWLGPWIDSRMLITYDQLGQPVDAIRLYLRMARAEVNPVFLFAPNASLLHLNEQTKAEMLSQVDSTLRGLTAGAVKDEVTKLRSAVDALDVGKAKSTLDAIKSNPNQSLSDIASAAVAVKSVVPLPRSLLSETGDEVTRMLAEGKFEEALTEADKWLNRTETGGLYKRLYQRGIALLYLAQKTEDSKLYKDAGLAFMRIVVYSPKGKFYGPALLEAGRVQQKIGRADLARQLYDKATLAVTEEEEPELAARLESVKAELAQSN